MRTDTAPTERTIYVAEIEVDGRELTMQQIGVDAETGDAVSVNDVLLLDLSDGAVLERDEAERVARELAAAHGWELDRFENELDSGNSNGYHYAAWPAG